MDPPNTTSYTLPPAEGVSPIGSVFVETYQRPSVARQAWAMHNVLVVLLTPILLIWLPLVYDDPKIHCAYVILIMAVYWVSEAVPIAATSLIPIFLFPMIGLLTSKTVSGIYVNDTSMLFLGGLIVAVAIETWDLHKRIALGVLVLVGAEPKWLMAGLMLVTWFLSMWISNTATTAMMIPIVQAILQQLKTTHHPGDGKETLEGAVYSGEGYQLCIEVEANEAYEMDGVDGKSPIDEKQVEVNTPGDTTQASVVPADTQSQSSAQEDANHLRMCKALSLCICYSANVGGIGSLTGTAPNVVLKGQSDIVFQRYNATSPISFATWMVYGLPLSFITLIVLWIWMQAFFLRFKGFCSCFCGGSSKDTAARVKAVIRSEFKKLGPISFAQWCIVIMFGLLVLLWITRDLGGVGGWGNLFNKGKTKFVSDSTPAIFISLFLFVCPATVPNIFCLRSSNDYNKPKIRPILKWQDVHEKMPWSLYLILGAGFSIARASQESGLSSWVGHKLAEISNVDPYVMVLILCYVVCFATEVTSNTAIATLMMPIMAELAVSLKVNPLFFMLPTAVATSFAFMLPVATPPNAIVFSYGQVRVIDMVTCGFVLNLITVPIIILATATWGNAFFAFDKLPEGFVYATTANPLMNLTTPSP